MATAITDPKIIEANKAGSASSALVNRLTATTGVKAVPFTPTTVVPEESQADALARARANGGTGFSSIEEANKAALASDPLVARQRAQAGATTATDPYILQAPDEAQIRAEKARQAQAMVNAVNQKFATIEAQDAQTVDLMNRERRASNVLSGLSGSTVGSARTIDTAVQGGKLKANTAAQKDAEIQAILSDAETRGSEEFQNQRTAFIAQQKDKLAAEQTFAANTKTAAMNGLNTLAGGDKSFDELKSSPGFLQIMKDSGMGEDEIRAAFIKASEANWEKIKEIDANGKTVFVYKNKTTGAMKTEELKLPDGLGAGYKFVPNVGLNGAWVKEGTNGQPGDVVPVSGYKTPPVKATPAGEKPYTPEQERAFVQGGIPAVAESVTASDGTKGTADPRNYFVNTDPAFQNEWQRNVASGKQKYTTLDALVKAYDAWFAAKDEPAWAKN